MLSVCTGALLLSKAGLLDGKQATTWYGFIDRLQEATPKAKILRNTRFVDNGQIVTTAGVSAGIDGALRVVTKLLGKEAARATAKYMEYDKWDPNAGLLIDNEFIGAVKKDGVEAALKAHQIAHAGNGNLPKFYDRNQEAIDVFKLNVAAFPQSGNAYDSLGEAYMKAAENQKAIESYNKALELDPSNSNATTMLKKLTEKS